MPELAKVEECTGCAACYNACTTNALEMKPDKEGFLYPVVDVDKCVECKLCERSCPIKTPILNTNATAPRAFAMWSNPDRILSSSGGAFSAFARKTLEKGGVVYGAAFDEHLHLHHIGIADIEGLGALRGSKYVQSEIGKVFKEIKKQLREGREVLFCGTPCQVEGLKTYLHKVFDNLILLDIACHGVPSDKVFHSYLTKLNNRYGKFDNFEFRKLDGWDKQTSVSFKGQKRVLYGTDNLYMEAFNKCGIFRKCCYKCQYSKTQRIGDCSLADFWGVGCHGMSFQHDMFKGVSLVLTNNEKGESIINAIKNQNVFIEERSLEEAIIENANLRCSSKMFSLRDSLISAFLDSNTNLKEINDRFHLVDNSLKGLIKKYAIKLNVFELAKKVFLYFKSH